MTLGLPGVAAPAEAWGRFLSRTLAVRHAQPIDAPTEHGFPVGREFFVGEAPDLDRP